MVKMNKLEMVRLRAKQLRTLGNDYFCADYNENCEGCGWREKFKLCPMLIMIEAIDDFLEETAEVE